MPYNNKTPDQRNLKDKGLFWLAVPRGGRPSRWRRQEYEAVRKQDQGSKNLKARPGTYFLQPGSAPTKGCTTFPRTAISWTPSIQIHEPVGDISHSNYNIPLNALM